MFATVGVGPPKRNRGVGPTPELTGSLTLCRLGESRSLVNSQALDAWCLLTTHWYSSDGHLRPISAAWSDDFQSARASPSAQVRSASTQAACESSVGIANYD